MNANEQAVRDAVAKTLSQSKIRAAEFKVEQAQRKLDAARLAVAPLQDAVREATAELLALKKETDHVK